jgi:hypothetical protein
LDDVGGRRRRRRRGERRRSREGGGSGPTARRQRRRRPTSIGRPPRWQRRRCAAASTSATSAAAAIKHGRVKPSRLHLELDRWPRHLHLEHLEKRHICGVLGVIYTAPAAASPATGRPPRRQRRWCAPSIGRPPRRQRRRCAPSIGRPPRRQRRRCAPSIGRPPRRQRRRRRLCRHARRVRDKRLFPRHFALRQGGRRRLRWRLGRRRGRRRGQRGHRERSPCHNRHGGLGDTPRRQSGGGRCGHRRGGDSALLRLRLLLVVRHGDLLEAARALEGRERRPALAGVDPLQAPGGWCGGWCGGWWWNTFVGGWVRNGERGVKRGEWMPKKG